MENELERVNDFIKSLETKELTDEQESILMVSEDAMYGSGKNKVTCEGTANDGCNNTGSCSNSNNILNCNNTGLCNYTNNQNTCTGGTGGGTGGTGGTGASAYGLIGFPGLGI